MSQKPKARAGPRKTKKASSKTQRERFIETARAVGVDESGAEFEKAIKGLVPRRGRRS